MTPQKRILPPSGQDRIGSRSIIFCPTSKNYPLVPFRPITLPRRHVHTPHCHYEAKIPKSMKIVAFPTSCFNPLKTLLAMRRSQSVTTVLQFKDAPTASREREQNTNSISNNVIATSKKAYRHWEPIKLLEYVYRSLLVNGFQGFQLRARNVPFHVH